MNKIKTFTILVLIGMFSLLLVACNNTNEELTYVTIETNPSVELVVDGKGIVVAVNGLNDDGKLLVDGEQIEGQKIEVATETIITLTEELGFTFTGNATADSQKITISVTSNAVEVAEQIQATVTTKANELITSLNLDAKVEIAEAKTKAYFEKIAQAYDPSLTDEEAEAMTFEELLAVCRLATIEKAQFATVKLEEYYNSIKEYEFKLKYKQEIASSLEDGYQELLTRYQELLTAFNNRISELKELEVYWFTDPESQYVKALNSFYEKKEELISKKVELSVKVQAGESTAQLQLTISGLETTLEIMENAVELADSLLQQAFATVITALETVYNQLEELEKEFPTTLNVEEKLTAAEKYINDSKDELFEKFEQSLTKEKLDAMKKEIADRKEALKQTVQEAKAK